jgi:hypothetical protein
MAEELEKQNTESARTKFIEERKKHVRVIEQVEPLLSRGHWCLLSSKACHIREILGSCSPGPDMGTDAGKDQTAQRSVGSLVFLVAIRADLHFAESRESAQSWDT